MNPLTMSAAALGRALAAGEVDPVELAQNALDAAQAAPKVFITVTRERALREAAAAKARLEAGRPASALDGVPIAWKDLVDMAGEATTAASALLRDAPPAIQDAKIVANAAAAGMVSIGKTNLTEFAYSGLGLNPHFGTPDNAYGAGRAPGGSSSGSAVAVAMGIVPCAVGTDTAGSVRIPASLNGLVGYKPSGGRICADGVFPLSKTLDSVGPIAKTTEDCVVLEAVLRGQSGLVVQRQALDTLAIMVPRSVVMEDLQSEVADNFNASLELLAKAGAKIEHCPVPEFEAFTRLTAEFGTITAAEAYLLHRDRLEGDNRAAMDSRVADRIIAGKKMSAVDLLTLQQARRTMIASLSERLGNALLAMPATAQTAPEIAPLEADNKVFHEMNLRMLRNTMIGSFLDTPGVALPNGFDGNGLPTSILISAASGNDELLLGYALNVETCVSRPT